MQVTMVCLDSRSEGQLVKVILEYARFPKNSVLSLSAWRHALVGTPRPRCPPSPCPWMLISFVVPAVLPVQVDDRGLGGLPPAAGAKMEDPVLDIVSNVLSRNSEGRSRGNADPGT